MPRRAVLRLPAVIVLTGMLAAVCLSACSEKDRHAVLDVLFDGVPPYIPPQDRARLRAEEQVMIAEEERQAETQLAARTRVVRKISRFTHGPFAAKECGSCHDLASSSGFRTTSANLAMMPGSSGELAEAGRLRMPVVELCVRCHADFSPQAPENAGMRMHGPVGVGWCVSCHQAHSSAYEHLVHADPPAKLCTQCHLRTDLLEFTAEHRPSGSVSAYPPAAEPPAEEPSASEEAVVVAQDQVVADCTSCHDPHRGLDRFILKASAPAKPSGGRGGTAPEATTAQ